MRAFLSKKFYSTVKAFPFLVLSLLLVGCGGVDESSSEEKHKTVQDQTERNQTEPDQTEPDQTEPDQTEPDQTEPDQTEPPCVRIVVALIFNHTGRKAS